MAAELSRNVRHGYYEPAAIQNANVAMSQSHRTSFNWHYSAVARCNRALGNYRKSPIP